MKKFYSGSRVLALGLLALQLGSCSNEPKKETDTANNSGITVPEGFTSSIFADSLGSARHLAVTKQGGIYVKLGDMRKEKGIVFLADTDGDGKADTQKWFSDYPGTGIYVTDSFLYASSNKAVYRYLLNQQGQVVDENQPATIVSGLIDREQHNSKSIVIDPAGNLYVNIGAYSNACQQEDRTKGSPGMKPCTILDSAGGIWQFRADKLDQNYSNGVRYATGLRNVVGLDWNRQGNQLFVMQHGRDQLHGLYPELYTEQQSADLPAETMYALNKGDNAGWPYIYYDQNQNKKILAPEYGGDGKKTGGEDAIDPAVAFPAHLAPNGLLFYTGTQFPEKYRNGAFIAFHGSWDRSPENQQGFFVAFVPFANGKPSGKWEIFANNFAGKEVIKSPGDALHRPCGLAQGPDGSLYVSDDVQGTIYKISYQK